MWKKIVFLIPALLLLACVSPSPISSRHQQELLSKYPMVVSGAREGGLHEYITRRAVPLAFCRAFVRVWKNLVLGEKIVCVSGSFTKRYRNKSGDLVSYWVFDRFKTKRGCESFFDGGCSFQYQLDQGCKEGVTQ